MISNTMYQKAAPASPLLRQLMKSKVCVEVMKAGGGSLKLPKGKHVLKLRVKKKDTYVLLTHMIWF